MNEGASSEHAATTMVAKTMLGARRPIRARLASSWDNALGSRRIPRVEERQAPTVITVVLRYLSLLVLFLALGTVTDTPLRAVVYEMAPPPLRADVKDRDASVSVTVHDDHGEAIR